MTPQRILVVVTRRIGDVLLTTPVIRSLRRAWPRAQIDALVFEGTEGVLKGNTDINNVITVATRSSLGAQLRLLARLWRRYDLALSMVPSDRPTLYAWAAGKLRIGLVAGGEKHAWKKWLLSQWVPFDNLDTHTVLMHLKLVEQLGIEPCHEVVAAWQKEDELQLRQVLPFDPVLQGYVVLHVYPMYAYKMWHREAWAELAHWLGGQGVRVVLTGGNAPEERAYIEDLLQILPKGALSVAGQLGLGGVACLLSRARAYVGPDTVVTHMAAALGVPTVALFGPSNPVKWGPWPGGYHESRNPYRMHGTQRVNNVVLVQGEGDCVPCMEEGCERRIDSQSRCLQELPVARVIVALQQLRVDEKKEG
jgi:lipopolysaccharide heptosyltransferase III